MIVTQTHSHLSPQDSGGLRGQVVLLALQGAHVADVAPGRVAVVPQDLVLMLGAFPLLEVTQRYDQGVSCEHRELHVGLDMLFAQ